MSALRTLLGLVVLLVVALVFPEVASAKSAIQAQSHVGVFDLDGQVRTGVEADAGARVHRGFGDASYDFTSRSPHAAKGRAGAQQRLRQIADDPKASSADRGWIRQEMNQIERGTRKNIRNPPGKQLAHPRGREAAKGFSHTDAPSNLQDTDLHRLQHRYDNFGRKNRRRD